MLETIPETTETPTYARREISFVIRDNPWRSTLWGDVADTTIYRELRFYESEEGLTPRDIFFIGLEYLSNIRDEHLLVNRSKFMTVEGRSIQEVPALRALRSRGLTNEQIFSAGLSQLLPKPSPAAPPRSGVPEEYEERLAELKRRGHADVAIFCAGIHYLSRLPPDIEWELQEPQDSRLSSPCLPEDGEVVNRAARRDESDRAVLHIYETFETSSHHYYVHDEEYSFEADAYLAEIEDMGSPHAQYVVLFTGNPDWPNFLYAPPQGLEGVPHKEAVLRALAAYRTQYPGLIPLPVLVDASDPET
jgi:hypothetical protein